MVKEVTLVVYGWDSVQPGTLAWVFPDFRAAVTAARTMRNASKWAIVRGKRASEVPSVEEERARGNVLLEQLNDTLAGAAMPADLHRE